MGARYLPTFEQQCIEKGKNKRYFTQHVFERIFNRLSHDGQVHGLCTCGSSVIDV